MRIQGKQLAYNTIEQNKLNLAIPVEPSDATRKDYVDSLINNTLSVERVSNENQNMAGSSGLTGIYIACNIPILEDTIYKSEVSVYVNGLKINCGHNSESFFSPDGILIRPTDDVRIGDRLYWNTTYADYNIENDDSIDFKYLTNDTKINTITLNTDETFIITTDDEITSLKFTGGLNETATLIIDDVSFTIGDVSGSFTFDIGDTNGYLHTFTYIGENYHITVNTNPYNIIWNGTSSIIFSVIKNYAFNITRYAGPTLYTTSTNQDEPILSMTDDFMVVGSNSTQLYLYEKVNEVWSNKQTISTFSETLYFTKMTDDYILGADRNGLFKVHKWNSSTETWDSGTTLQSAMGGGYEVYGHISDNQIITGDGRADSNNGIVRIYTENSGGTWDYITLTNPASVGLGQSGVLLKKNEIAVVGTWDYNKIFVYNYISGTSWSSGIELDRLPGELLTIDTIYSGNRILDIKDDLILCGAPGVEYDGTNTGIAYIYEYSGGTWWPSQLPFPTGDTTDLFLGSCGKIVTYEGSSGTTYSTGQTYLYVGTEITSSSLGKFFIYKQSSGGTWELYSQIYESYCHTAFDVDNQLNIITSSTSYVYSLPFYGHQIDKVANRTGIPIIGSLTITGTKEIGNYVSLSYSYIHPTYIDENTNDTGVIWYTKSYLSESYTLRTDLSNNKTPYVDSNLYGKHTLVTVTPVDENGNSGVPVSYSETLLDTDNTAFNSNTPILSQSIILTIISGNAINGNGPGVYILLGTHNVKQSTGTSSWGIGFNTGGHDIYIYGTVGGYNSMSITINGSATNTAFTDTAQTGYVSDSIFTQYTLGGTVFTIAKNTGWR